MPAYDLLIFDLDGTICDPLDGIHRSINYALEAIEHPPVPENVVAQFIGPPLYVAFKTILPTATSALVDA
jgi:phosphoglycolate phosphatase